MTEYDQRENLKTGDDNLRTHQREHKRGKWREAMKQALIPKLKGAKGFKQQAELNTQFAQPNSVGRFTEVNAPGKLSGVN